MRLHTDFQHGKNENYIFTISTAYVIGTVGLCEGCDLIPMYSIEKKMQFFPLKVRVFLYNGTSKSSRTPSGSSVD
jgi:hypothetical protein